MREQTQQRTGPVQALMSMQEQAVAQAVVVTEMWDGPCNHCNVHQNKSLSFERHCSCVLACLHQPSLCLVPSSPSVGNFRLLLTPAISLLAPLAPAPPSFHCFSLLCRFPTVSDPGAPDSGPRSSHDGWATVDWPAFSSDRKFVDLHES